MMQQKKYKNILIKKQIIIEQKKIGENYQYYYLKKMVQIKQQI